MVGSKIKCYLDANGIKYGFLADKLGMTQSVISDLLNDKRRIECVEYLNICKCLNVPLETFFEDEEVKV